MSRIICLLLKETVHTKWLQRRITSVTELERMTLPFCAFHAPVWLICSVHAEGFGYFLVIEYFEHEFCSCSLRSNLNPELSPVFGFLRADVLCTKRFHFVPPLSTIRQTNGLHRATWKQSVSLVVIIRPISPSLLLLIPIIWGAVSAFSYCQ